MSIRGKLRQLITRRAQTLWPELQGQSLPIELPEPQNASFGDYATNIAMRLAPLVKDNSLRIAEKLAHDLFPQIFASVQVVAPGFLNITLADNVLKRTGPAILKEGKRFGQSDAQKGLRIHVEFISANPTGPLHLGNGRGAFMGDVLSNALAASGSKVWREYYVNDRGKQVSILAESVVRKYFILQGVVMDYPDYCYQGSYVDDLAAGLKLDGVKIADMDRLRKRIQSKVLNTMLRSIQQLVEKRLQVHFDTWFRESALYEQGLDKRVLAKLKEQGLLYEHEGATWMKTTQFGDDKDRVLIKSDGEKTYFFSDVMYVYDKFVRRKFDRAIVRLGADHHGYIGRLKAAAAALGYKDQLEIIIHQLVRLIRDGQEVKMSKRAGTFVTLDELIDEVGPDVARFFFLMQSADSHLDFDLDLAKEQSEKNPVFYVQYAHARICSLVKKVDGLLKKKGKKGSAVRTVRGEFGDSEKKLTKSLLRLPDVVEDVAQTYAIQKLPFYAQRLAQSFHEYYDTARVIDNDTVNLTRLQMVKATHVVLANTLRLMGVNAPRKM